MRSFAGALFEGTAYAVIGLLIVLVMAANGWPSADNGILSSQFASRWDGSCTGWTRLDAWAFLIGSGLHWWAYCTIAFVFWRLHPALKTVPYSTTTLSLVGCFILGCGITHLVAVYTLIHPVYRLEMAWLIVNGIVSDVATVFVAFSLTRAFEVVHARRKKIEENMAELEQLRNKRG